MPVIASTYRSPFLFLSRHIETIYPVLFRDVSDVTFTRERLELEDGDFLDLDWIKKGSKHLVILSHGLEGSTESNYLRGMARAASGAGYDVLAWNYRGCSGEINRLFRFYHSGESADLHLVIQYILNLNHYNCISLIGFSVGGNITLKYLGEQGEKISALIKNAVVFSVPCHLEAGAMHMAGWKSRIYMRRFLDSLHGKIKAKAKQYPDRINDEGFGEIRNFLQFDQRYTAPIHGFKDAYDYWKLNSSLYFIPFIRIPTLLVSAQNDPFLTPECFPVKEAEANPCFFLEMPERGGHCGFYENNSNGNYWSDNRALAFIGQ